MTTKTATAAVAQLRELAARGAIASAYSFRDADNNNRTTYAVCYGLAEVRYLRSRREVEVFAAGAWAAMGTYRDAQTGPEPHRFGSHAGLIFRELRGVLVAGVVPTGEGYDTRIRLTLD